MIVAKAPLCRAALHWQVAGDRRCIVDGRTHVALAGRRTAGAAGARSAQGFFSGYFDEAATDEGWRGGWWHTGDIARGSDGSPFLSIAARTSSPQRQNISAVEVGRHCCNMNWWATGGLQPAQRFAERSVRVHRRVDQDAGRGLAQEFSTMPCATSRISKRHYIVLVGELPLTASQKIARGKRNAMRSQWRPGRRQICAELAAGRGRRHQHSRGAGNAST
jgi:hypothetical protein